MMVFMKKMDRVSGRSCHGFLFLLILLLIRRMTGQRVVDINSREALEGARVALNEKKKLMEIFLKSLGN